MFFESDSGVLVSLRESLSAILPGSVSIALWGLDTLDDTLLPPEDRAVARAVEKRREEFARGRACARAALQALGKGPVPIGVGPGRQPIWPEGFVGSITHGAGIVAAAVANIEELSALGIDVESLEPLSSSVQSMVVQPEDRLGDPGKEGKIVFSAKESVFKALYPICGLWMEFDAVSVLPGKRRMELLAQPTGRNPAPVEVTDLRGGYRTSAGRVLTAFWREVRGPAGTGH
jgi:4'-phosphopantetheinyl transferase EntD